MRKLMTLTMILTLAGCMVSISEACEKGGERRAKLIEKFDKDGDGKLSKEERTTARESFKGKAGKRKAEFIKKFDKDGDGELSEEERTDARASMKKKCNGRKKGNNGVGNGQDPQPPGNPPVNDGEGTSPGNPGQR